MKPQKSYHKGNTRVLAANGSIMNIEYSPSPVAGKLMLERSPKRGESFRIKKSKRFEANEPSCSRVESSDKTQGIISSSQFDSNAAQRNSAYTNRGYVPASGAVVQYTLMNYSNGFGQLNSANAFVGKSSDAANVSPLNARPQETSTNEMNHIFDDFEQFSFQTFPSYFNPRAATNMPHQEKVNKWIENVPTFIASGEHWRSDCYGVELEADWEEQEFDLALSQHQDHNPFSFNTADEILHLQAKRLDSLVRKLYDLTPEIPLNFPAKRR
ncbi:LAME_0G06766g1_1 [Lachancea meyersii CBS 8951]|uniref:LAME_0G06766g1_1 n=1 Tax=Lachancea meyersii CBS 8951 TaxID=1266667 RepID=A0A1G4K7N6_9SACH|nr:LAME_0G06766g1_1 [Lachancea meyersii CBS 8951]